MKKKFLSQTIISILFVLMLSFTLFGCISVEVTTDDADEESTTPTEYTFQDLNIALDSSWKGQPLSNVESYTSLSRKDYEGFVDEYILLNEEDFPVVLYCFNLSDPNTTYEDLLNAAKEAETDSYVITETQVSNVPAIQATTITQSDEGTAYFPEITFLLNSKMYCIWTGGMDEDDVNNKLSSICKSISF